MDEHELRNLMYSAQLPGQGSYVIRYPRGKGVLVDWKNEMEDYPASTLHETIARFHDTPNRYANFEKALAADALGRRPLPESLPVNAGSRHRYFPSVLLDR